MAKSFAHVIVVENNGIIDEEVDLPAGDDYLTFFSDFYRMGWRGDIYTLYRIEGNTRVFVETYKFDDK